MKSSVLFESSLAKIGAELLAVALAIPVMASMLAPVPYDLMAAGEWGPRILITDDNANNTDHSGDPAVAFDMFGNLYVAWEEESELDGSGPDMDIYLKKWNATTRAWGPRVLVTYDNLNNTENSLAPQIVTDSFGNVHIVWYDNSDLAGFGFGAIYWEMYDAGTESWTQPVPVSYDVNDTGPASANPRVAADQFGNVHLTFHKSMPDSAYGIQYMRFDGTTRTWGTKMTVSGNSTEFENSAIAADPLGDVHVVWDDCSNISGASAHGKDKDIFYRRLVASTNSWGPIVHVNDDDQSDVYGSEVGSIVADIFGNIHVVWHEDMDQAGLGYGLDLDIFYRKWNAASGVWEPRVVVSSDPADAAGSVEPELSADGRGDVHIVWRDKSDVDGAGAHAIDVFYRKWNALNDTWENTTSLTNDLNDQLWAWEPDVASDRYGNLAVVWRDGSGLLGSGSDADVYLRRVEVPFEELTATVDCDPDTLNLRSKGKWITCYLELPPGYDPRDIDASTILLNDVLPPELDPKYGFVKSESSYIMDHDGDGVLERMVKFNRSDVQQLLSPGDSVQLKITGQLYDGTEFEGTDEIRVIDPIQSAQSMDEQIPRHEGGFGSELGFRAVPIPC